MVDKDDIDIVLFVLGWTMCAINEYKFVIKSWNFILIIIENE